MKAKQIGLYLGLSGLLFFSFYTASAQHRRYFDDYHSRSYYRQRVIYRHPGIVIPYSGISYHYNTGAFYRPYGAGLQIIAPPIGIRVGFLPNIYFPVRMRTGVFFYSGGTFYKPYNDQYEVVVPPVGAEVPELPRGANAVVINGNKYYEWNNTYYKEVVKDNGELWYRVAGRDGVLNTEKNPNNNGSTGDTISILPEGCHTVLLNGQTYYVAPDGTYYQEMQDEQNEVYYKIVGKSSVAQ